MFTKAIVKDVQRYCDAHNVHPDNARLMLKIARNLPRYTPCTAQDIATHLCIGVVVDTGEQDSIYGSRNSAK